MLEQPNRSLAQRSRKNKKAMRMQTKPWKNKQIVAHGTWNVILGLKEVRKRRGGIGTFDEEKSQHHSLTKPSSRLSKAFTYLLPASYLVTRTDLCLLAPCRSLVGLKTSTLSHCRINLLTIFPQNNYSE